MRISTPGFFNNALQGMLRQQSALAVTQSQLATGKRIQTPADDPIGAVHVLALNRALLENDQFGRNADAATSRLTMEEQALSDVNHVIRRVRDLVLQVNNSSVDAVGRGAIASELQNRAQELTDIVNRQDGKGEYLFSGYAVTTQPFDRVGVGVNYFGDQGVRTLQTGPTQRIADGHSGFEAFMNIPQGNGSFVTATAAANAGSGSISVGQVIDAAAWSAAQPNSYTIVFTAPGAYQIQDSGANIVGGGTYAAGGAILVNGASVTIDGAPATGDSFTLTPSQKEAVFTTLDNIISAIKNTDESPAARAQFTTQMAAALQQLDQDENHLLRIRTEVGARLSTLDDAKAARENASVELQRMRAEIEDVDFVSAISRMNQQHIALEAAQKSYAQISQLSLFNYLR